MAPLFDDIYAGARAQGLPLRTLMSEYAPGQYEITLLHRDDALRAIAAAESSTFLREALGEQFVRAFVAIKTQEWDKYNALVPPTDHDWYLDSV